VAADAPEFLANALPIEDCILLGMLVVAISERLQHGGFDPDNVVAVEMAARALGAQFQRQAAKDRGRRSN